MPTSNETRVRVEGFWKIIPSVRPGRRRCSSPAFCARFSSSPRSRTRRSSSRLQSATLVKSRPLRSSATVGTGTILLPFPAALDRGPHEQASDRDCRRDLDEQPGGPAVAEDQPRESNHIPPTVYSTISPSIAYCVRRATFDEPKSASALSWAITSPSTCPSTSAPVCRYQTWSALSGCTLTR